MKRNGKEDDPRERLQNKNKKIRAKEGNIYNTRRKGE